MNGEDSARCGLAGLEKEWPGQRAECIGAGLSHQVMLGGYQIETSSIALYPTGLR